MVHVVALLELFSMIFFFFFCCCYMLPSLQMLQFHAFNVSTSLFTICHFPAYLYLTCIRHHKVLHNKRQQQDIKYRHNVKVIA